MANKSLSIQPLRSEIGPASIAGGMLLSGGATAGLILVGAASVLSAIPIAGIIIGVALCLFGLIAYYRANRQNSQNRLETVPIEILAPFPEQRKEPSLIETASPVATSRLSWQKGGVGLGVALAVYGLFKWMEGVYPLPESPLTPNPVPSTPELFSKICPVPNPLKYPTSPIDLLESLSPSDSTSSLFTKNLTSLNNPSPLPENPLLNLSHLETFFPSKGSNQTDSLVPSIGSKKLFSKRSFFPKNAQCSSKPSHSRFFNGAPRTVEKKQNNAQIVVEDSLLKINTTSSQTPSLTPTQDPGDGGEFFVRIQAAVYGIAFGLNALSSYLGIFWKKVNELTTHFFVKPPTPKPYPSTRGDSNPGRMAFPGTSPRGPGPRGSGGESLLRPPALRASLSPRHVPLSPHTTDDFDEETFEIFNFLESMYEMSSRSDAPKEAASSEMPRPAPTPSCLGPMVDASIEEYRLGDHGRTDSPSYKGGADGLSLALPGVDVVSDGSPKPPASPARVERESGNRFLTGMGRDFARATESPKTVSIVPGSSDTRGESDEKRFDDPISFRSSDEIKSESEESKEASSSERPLRATPEPSQVSIIDLPTAEYALPPRVDPLVPHRLADSPHFDEWAEGLSPYLFTAEFFSDGLPKPPASGDRVEMESGEGPAFALAIERPESILIRLADTEASFVSPHSLSADATDDLDEKTSQIFDFLLSAYKTSSESDAPKQAPSEMPRPETPEPSSVSITDISSAVHPPSSREDGPVNLQESHQRLSFNPYVGWRTALARQSRHWDRFTADGQELADWRSRNLAARLAELERLEQSSEDEELQRALALNRHEREKKRFDRRARRFDSFTTDSREFADLRSTNLIAQLRGLDALEAEAEVEMMQESAPQAGERALEAWVAEQTGSDPMPDITFDAEELNADLEDSESALDEMRRELDSPFHSEEADGKERGDPLSDFESSPDPTT